MNNTCSNYVDHLLPPLNVSTTPWPWAERLGGRPRTRTPLAAELDNGDQRTTGGRPEGDGMASLEVAFSVRSGRHVVRMCIASQISGCHGLVR